MIPNGGSAACTITNDDKKATPAGETSMSWVLHDKLTFTGLRSGSPAPAATVTFKLFSDAQCAVQVGTSETVQIVSGVAKTAAGVTVIVPDTYYWQAFYSGDQYNAPFATRCGYEVTTVGSTVTLPAVAP